MTSPGGFSDRHCTGCGSVHPANEPCPNGKGARTGEVLDGKYELVRLLGQGGMGEVYEGRHTKIGRRVAVKFLHAHFAHQAEVARRFENEARAAGGMAHENIAAVYDVGALADGTQYLVMEFLEGEDVARLLSREGRLSLGRAADIVAQACLGLEIVHRQGIVHRDLKPANLFVAKRPNGADLIKVLDFGIAKLRAGEGGASATKTGTAIGTAYYMSPEQARGERDISSSSDLYALGVIFYELLSGQRPHDGESLLQILHRVLTQPPTPLEDVAPGLPAPIYSIVRKAMATSPAERFASVTEFAAAIGPYATSARPSSYTPAGSTQTGTAAAVARAAHSSAPPTIDAAAKGRSESVVGVARSTPAAPSAKRPIAPLVGGVAAVAVAAIGGFVLASRNERPIVASAPSATVSVASPTPIVSISPPVAPVELAPATPQAVPQTAPQTTPQPVLVASPSRGKLAPRPALVAAPTTAATPSAAPKPAAPKVDCTTPFFYDAKGNQVFKPECVE